MVNKETISRSNRYFPQRDFGKLKTIGKPTDKFQNLWDSFKNALKYTFIEVPLIAALGATLGLSLSVRYEAQKERQLPLAFAEVSQMERDAEAEGKSFEEEKIARFYAFLNDAIMKTIECSNLSWDQTRYGSNYERFARELENKIDPALNHHHYRLDQILEMLPKLGKEALKKMQEFQTIQGQTRRANQSLDSTWEDFHVDNYHTEYYTETVTETVTDSDGNTHTESHEEIRSREVYDDTTHTYNYSNSEGEEASARLSKMAREHGNFKWPENLRRVETTNAEGEWAAQVSRQKGDKQVRLSQSELLTIANTWNTGSSYNMNKQTLLSCIGQIPNHAKRWGNAKQTAHNERYKTTRHSDDGPEEFQIAESALANGRVLDSSISEVIDGINRVIAEAPQLESAIKQYIAVTLDNKKGSERELQRYIMNTVKNWYMQNYSGGFNITPFNWLSVIGFTFLGGFLGAGAGALLDKAGDQFNWYRKKEEY
jgi:hypothetical protein